MKSAVLPFILTLITPLFLNAQDAEYEELLSKYFEVSGSEQTFAIGIKQTVQTMRSQASGLDDETWNELEKEFLGTSIDELVEMLVPVYAKYLSADDLRGIITFYESPVGKKLSTTTPLLTQESMQVGGQWGMELGQKVMQRIEEKKNK